MAWYLKIIWNNGDLVHWYVSPGHSELTDDNLVIHSAIGQIGKNWLTHSPHGQNVRHIAHNIFIFVYVKFCILIKISLNFVSKGPVDNKSALV